MRMDERDDFRPTRPGLQGKGHIVYEDVTPFSLSQRLNRLRFACYSLSASIVLLLVLTLAWVLLKAALGEGAKMWLGLIVPVLALAFFGYYVSLVVRRLHDLGRNGWWAMLMFGPLLEPALVGKDMLLLLAMLLQPLLGIYLLAGNPCPGMNRFGTPNPPNGMLVNLFGGLAWIVSVVLLLAQIAVAVVVVMQPERLEPVLKEIERIERQMERITP